MKLPANNLWATNPKSDLASLWSSFNLDLQSNLGHTRVSPRLLLTTDNITDLDVAVAFQTFTDVNGGAQYFWAIAGKYVWRASTADAYVTAFAKDASSGTPSGSGTDTSCSSDYSDLVSIGTTSMVLSLRTRMYFYTASTGAWLNVQYDTGGTPAAVTLTDGGVHMQCVFAGRTYVTDENTKVRSVSNSDLASASASSNLTSSGTNYLNLASKGYPVTIITTIRSTSNRIWIGTLNQSEDGCYMFAWDGSTTTDPNEAYIIPDASGILAIIIRNDSPWIIDNNARLMYFSGGTFIEAPNGRLPVKQPKFLKNSLSSKNDRWIHPNGIRIVDGRIRILINNENTDSSTTIEENIPSGVWEYDPANPSLGWCHISSLSYYAASAGTVTDYGQNRVSRVGALFEAKDDSSTATANGTMLLGAQYYSDASSTRYGIWTDDSNDTVQKFGYLVTGKIYSENILDVWQKAYPRFKKLLDSSDFISVKYRTSEVAPVEATITWTSATTFTTTTDVSGYANYEVEILQGKGGGKCSIISSVVNNAGTYTVTTQETFTGATSGTAKARFQFWKNAGRLSDQTSSFFTASIMDDATWVQLKICFQFKGRDELDDIILAAKTQQFKAQ